MGLSPRHHDEIIQAQAQYKKAVKSFKMDDIRREIRDRKSYAPSNVTSAVMTPESKHVISEIHKFINTPFSTRNNQFSSQNIDQQLISFENISGPII